MTRRSWYTYFGFCIFNDAFNKDCLELWIEVLDKPFYRDIFAIELLNNYFAHLW